MPGSPTTRDGVIQTSGGSLVSNAIPDSGVYLDDYADNKLTSRDTYETTAPEDDLKTDVQSSFSDPSRAEWSTEAGSPAAQNQRLELPGSQDDQVTATSPMSDGTWEFEFTPQGTSSLILRAFVHTTQASGDGSPNANGDGYELVITGGGAYELLRQDSGIGTTLIGGSWSPDTNTHTARVEAFLDGNSDRNWEIYLDGSQVGSTVIDNNYDTPQLWLLNRDADAIYIDNYRVF
jgi:hypothetical protein